MITIAIIGCGGMANKHAERLSAITDCSLVAACDLRQETAQSFCRRHNIRRCYTDYRQLLDECDCQAVVVATTDPLHAPISIAALQAGKHVLCEKPLATDYQQAQQMVRAAEESGTVNMVNFSYRDSAALQHAATLVAEGRIGRVVHASTSYLQSWLCSRIWGDWRSEPRWLWRLSQAHGSLGVLGDLGVHILDFLSFPIGARATSVSCQLTTFPHIKGETHAGYTLDANDLALVQLTFSNHAVGDARISRWAGGYVNHLSLALYGESGAIRLDLDQDWNTLELCVGEDLHQAHWQRIPCPPTPHNHQRFLHAIADGSTATPDFRRGADIQLLLDSCLQANQQGKAVVLPGASPA